MIDDIPQHVGALAVLDQPKRIAAELKIVPPLIDAEGPVAFDIDAALDVGDQSSSLAWPGSRPMLAMRTIGTLTPNYPPCWIRVERVRPIFGATSRFVQ